MFEPNVLVWLAASDSGISESFFFPSGLTVNKATFEEDFINGRLVLFIKTHHADGNNVFWPDLVSLHYAKTVTDFYEGHDINLSKKLKIIRQPIR